MLYLFFILSYLFQINQIELTKVAEITEVGDYFLSGIRSVQVLDNNLIIANGDSYQIIIADMNGNYVHSFGRNGAGPGEFRNLNMMATSPQSNSIITWDQGLARLSEFNLNGYYINNVSFGGRFMGIAIDFENNIYLSALNLAGPDKLLSKVTFEDEVVGKFIDPDDYTLNVHRSGNVGGLTYCKESNMTYYAFTFPYKIVGIDSQGDVQFTFEHDHQDFTPPAGGGTLGNMMLGGTLDSRISSLLSTDDKLWVQYQTPNGNFLDVIGKEKNEIIQTISLPTDHRLGVAEGGLLYTYTVGREATPKIVKWEIK